MEPARAELHPMTVGQQSLWLLGQLASSASFGNLCTALRLTPHVRLERLTAALRAIYRKHDILRARLVGEAAPHIAIGHVDDMQLTTRTVSGWDDVDRNAWLETECLRPLRLDESLCRFALLENQKDDRTREMLLLLVQHHLVSDFRSVEILTQELEVLYHTPHAPGEAEARSFIDYARQEASWLCSAEAQAQRDFWHAELASLQPVDIGHRVSQDRTAPFTGIERRTTLRPVVTSAARAAARRHGVTPFTFMLAVFGVMLGGLSSQRAFAVGTTIDLRRERIYRQTVGYLVNTIPVPMRVDPSDTFAHFASLASRSIATSMRHGKLPFAEIARQMPLRSGMHRQLRSLETMFTWLNFESDFASEEPGKLIQDTLAPGECRVVQTSQEIVLSIEDRADTFECVWTVSSDFFPRVFGERLATRFAELVEKVSVNATIRMSELLDFSRIDLASPNDVMETLEL